ncbi:MAG: cell division/cell wall cluster transcriptional repressor MraZ [Gammaproteobacteria bacterium RIFCSPHIGHO2_12_FULL_40_19]|nr:MAG: cell division/cell wall cluster transcriptional repressor MraZ [Gammaproteobacteria bacterium RIFCSPHIGHO2_12_FULL_40_19]
MFRGLSSGQIDSKGRITIPANYRTLMVEESSGSLVVTIDTESRCLLLYPFPAWQIIEEKLESLPSFQPSARRIQRLLMGHATELELDRQGRILLPNLLRDYAELDKTVMLVGQGKKIEIWSEPLWEDARVTWLAESMNENHGVPMELAMLSL